LIRNKLWIILSHLKKYAILRTSMKRFLLRVMGELASPSPRLKRAGLFLVFFVFLGLIIGHSVFAVDSVNTEETEGIVSRLLGILAGLIMTMVNLAGSLVVLVIGKVLMPVLLYNDFVNSPIVGMGWSVIRDAVNMFFVVVLILIAFGTILGLDRFKWRQQVPRLMIMAVMINFSRTLCGILIDFSQIITLTFVNAIKDIAGGNFIQMLGLRNITEVDSVSRAVSTGVGVSGSDIFIAAAASLIMMLIVLIVIIFFTIIMAYRIVMLWTLVTIAPLTWFTKALEGIATNAKSGGYDKWWKKFNCTLQIGPVLAFFLWLALAVAGSGNVSEYGFDEALNTATASTEASSALQNPTILKALGGSNLVSFVIGILLLFVGLDAANDVCSGESNITSLLGKAKAYSKPVAAAPAAAAAWVGAKGLQAARATVRGTYNQTLGRGVTAAKRAAGSGLTRLGKSNKMPSFIANVAARTGKKLNAGLAAEADFRVKDKNLTTDEMVRALKSGPSKLDPNGLEYAALLKQAMGNDDVLTALGSKGMAEVFGKDLGGGKGSAIEFMKGVYAADPSVAKKIDEMKEKRPSMFGKEAIEKIEASEDVDKLDKNEFKNKAVRDQVLKAKFRYEDKDTGEEITTTIGELLASGKNVKGLGKYKDLLEKGAKGQVEERKQTMTERPVRNIKGEDIEELTATELKQDVVERLVTQGSVDQATALGKDSRRQAVVRGHAAQILKQTKEKNSGTRTVAVEGVIAEEAFRDDKAIRKVRENLFAATGDFGQAFDVDAGGSVTDDEAISDLTASMKGNGAIIAAAMKQGGSARAMALRSVNESLAKDLVKKLRGAENVDKRAKIEEQIKAILEGLGDHIGILPDDGSFDEERARLSSLVEVLNRATAKPAPPPTT